MLRIIITLGFLLALNVTTFSQEEVFPVNEKTKRISFAEIYGDLNYSQSILIDRTIRWYQRFFDGSINVLESVGKQDGRIFLNAYSKFIVYSTEKGKRKEYTVRLNYALRIFIREGDFRYELTNLTFGTQDKPNMISAEELFDPWHLKSYKAGTDDENDRTNYENILIQYKNHAKVIIDHIVSDLVGSVIG